jgi:hypothetical protein
MRPSCVWVRARDDDADRKLQKSGIQHVSSHPKRRGFVPNLVKAVKVQVRSPSSSVFALRNFLNGRGSLPCKELNSSEAAIKAVGLKECIYSCRCCVKHDIREA